MLIKPKKSLGQNFLIDKNIIRYIADIAEINENDTLLEIGPGTGNLTKQLLLKRPKKIIVVEKDKNLSKELKNNFDNQIQILNEDILKIDEEILSKEKMIFFGNLPYNISTQILIKWIVNDLSFNSYKKLVLMFQKDVAERIIAQTNQKEFGRLSVISNWRLNVEKNFDVSKDCFFPKPKVESSVISFTPKKNYKHFKNSKSLEHITRIFFSNKRKMINKAYKNLFKDNFDIATQLNLNLKCRPSNLTCQNYYSLASFYEKLIY